MNEEKLMAVLSNVNDDFITESMVDRQKTKAVKIRWVAVAAAVFVLCLVFAQTSVGVAAVEYVKNQLTSVVEMLFPDSEIAVWHEGETEMVLHHAVGKEPETTQNGMIIKNGFAIYIITQSYEIVDGQGVTFIRPIPALLTEDSIISANEALLEGLNEKEMASEIDRLMTERKNFYSSLPPCEIEIVYLQETPSVTIESIRNELAGDYDYIYETETDEQTGALHFFASKGNEWNSPCLDVYVFDDGNQGAYLLQARYFREAAEWHGNYFRQMIETFSVID